MIGWTHHTPCRAVISACSIAAVLLFVGASAHATELLGHGLHPYDWTSGWLNRSWSSPALFDVLVAVLLIRGSHRGSELAAQSGLRRLTIFAVLVPGAAPFIRRHLTN
ncbi:hypothetical protein [Streptomyces roseolilacinus]|uniref:DUF2637 domain-containing protein n=1 Tax=Streptomyces roseolilacinus TaxID=66904 RepID=A0A918AY82_9ACTN|nr:hypothetical protein [Streptomyces roseolilacinus]GGP87712.1 hypothetical protein GCM10010249_01260 [Streptomyces roseolilacinus]